MDTLTFFGFFAIYWMVLIALAVAKRMTGLLQSKLLPPILVTGYIIFMLANFANFYDWQRLWLACVGLLFTMKSALLLSRAPERRLPGEVSKQEPTRFRAFFGTALYMSIWPGFDIKRLERRQPTGEDGSTFVPGYVSFWIGAFLMLATATLQLTPDLKTWFGLLSILLMLHFGYAVMLGAVLRIAGFDVRQLFNRPELSTSLRDFWSHRWNIAFNEMTKQLFVPALMKRFSAEQTLVVVFLISGVLHDLALSYPIGSGYGFPTLYFMLQACALLVERRCASFFTKHKLISRVWTYCWILVPLPMLASHAFRMHFIMPVVTAVTGLLHGLTPVTVLSAAIWCAGIGHFCTLMAGLQVPFRFNWKEELAKLSRFNQKIMLNYAGYTGLMIVSFGYLTLKLHDQFLAGGTVIVNLAGLIAIFWIVRILVDMFYFRHDDWPKGPEFVIGHTLLVSLFLAMAAVYTYIVIINCFQINLGLRPWL